MRRDFFICLLLAGMTLAIYWPVGRLGFIDNDDKGPRGYIVNNTNIQSGITVESVGWAFTTMHAGNWHPVTWLSHMVDWKLFGLNAGGHHWMNLGFHIANTLLLFIVWRKMTGAVWRSALVAALFAAHPTHVQSVAWVSERKDLLSGFFMLLTLWAYAGFVEQSTVHSLKSKVQSPKSKIFGSVIIWWRRCCPSEAARQRGPTNFKLGHYQVFYGLALGFFALGLMSKPMLVTLPLILLVLDFWPLRRFTIYDLPVLRSNTAEGGRITIAPLLREKIPFLAMSVASSIVTFQAQARGGAVLPAGFAPLDWRIESLVVSYATYLWKMAWPVKLAIFYPHARIPAWEALGCGLLLAGLTVFCVRRMRSRPYLLAGWCWFVVMLVPVIGIVPFGMQSVADRYTYLPSIGLFIMAAWGMAELAGGSKLRQAGLTLGAAGLVLACLLDTRYQLRYWRDSVTLFRRAVAVTGENFMGDYFLGNAYWDAGNLDAAVTNYQYVVRVAPDFAGGHYALGRVLLLQKNDEAAEAQFGEVLRLQPNNPYVCKFLGDALSGEGKFEDAEAEYSFAAQLKPGDPVIEDARQKNQFLETLRSKPDSPEILNDLAWLLATSENEQTRDGVEAVKHAERACDLTHYRETVMVGTLAAAYAEAGRFAEAVATAQKACALASESGQQELLKRNRELLELYRAHKAYHETAAN